MKITREMVVSWEPCEGYSPERIAELCPEEGLTPLEVARLDISVEHRIWVLQRSDVLGDRLLNVLAGYAERAIRRTLGKSGSPLWEDWAENWLSGKDRSASAARSAQDATNISAARYAARCAEWSVAYAKRGFSETSYAARCAAWSVAHAEEEEVSDASYADRDAVWSAARDRERSRQLTDIVAVLEEAE